VLLKGCLVQAPNEASRLYVTTAVRLRAELHDVIAAIRPVVQSVNGQIGWHMGPNESDVAARLRAQGFAIRPLRTQNLDKLVRARRVLLPAWNAGRVLVNDRIRYRAELVNEVERFTGTRSDPHDDVVDALAALADVLGMRADDDACAHVDAAPWSSLDWSRVARSWRGDGRSADLGARSDRGFYFNPGGPRPEDRRRGGGGV
jgi:hypothetical protein